MGARRGAQQYLAVHSLASIKSAARDRSPISGLTHCFYRYPARFSPNFVASAIEAFSSPCDAVLDPYMGGGTAIVEAIARGRQAVGCDVNSLAVFVARVKTTPLAYSEQVAVRRWTETTSQLMYHTNREEAAELICEDRTRNLGLPRARPAKKLLAQAMLALRDLPGERPRAFARCVLLNVAQWALNNRKNSPSLSEIRAKVTTTTEDMLSGLEAFSRQCARPEVDGLCPVLIHGSAEFLPSIEPFATGRKARLVLTSPPYPGIHILYHRWQIDGRRETPAPYWIADCLDSKGSSFYNFADRRKIDCDDYFVESLRTLESIRSVVTDDAWMVQLIAFSNPRNQLRRYLRNMELAGFREVRTARVGDRQQRFRRIWRGVPGRAWYANLKGQTTSSREVVLIHRAA